MNKEFMEEYEKLKALDINEKDITVIIDLLRVIIQTETDKYFDGLEAMND